MSSALRSVAILVALAVLSGASIAWLAALVEGDIADNRREAELRALRELASEAGVHVEVLGQGDVLFCEPGLAIVRTAAKGYGGEIAAAVAIRGDGRVSGVRVLRHAETPGFADILAPGSTWLADFRSRAPSDVHAVTGATVTSRAVIAAVESAVETGALGGPCALAPSGEGL